MLGVLSFSLSQDAQLFEYRFAFATVTLRIRVFLEFGMEATLSASFFSTPGFIGMDVTPKASLVLALGL
jgi:hypothetical protein